MMKRAAFPSGDRNSFMTRWKSGLANTSEAGRRSRRFGRRRNPAPWQSRCRSSSSICSKIPDMVLCIVSNMVRRLFMLSISGGNSASSCGMIASILSRSGVEFLQLLVSRSTPSSESIQDLSAQQTGML